MYRHSCRAVRNCTPLGRWRWKGSEIIKMHLKFNRIVWRDVTLSHWPNFISIHSFAAIVKWFILHSGHTLHRWDLWSYYLFCCFFVVVVAVHTIRLGAIARSLSSCVRIWAFYYSYFFQLQMIHIAWQFYIILHFKRLCVLVSKCY